MTVKATRLTPRCTPDGASSTHVANDGAGDREFVVRLNNPRCIGDPSRTLQISIRPIKSHRATADVVARTEFMGHAVSAAQNLDEAVAPFRARAHHSQKCFVTGALKSKEV